MRLTIQVDLYVKKKVVRRGIPSAEACDELIQLIKQHGKWIDPPPPPPSSSQPSPPGDGH